MNQQSYFYPKNNLKEFIYNFFDNYPLEDAKSKLWELLKAAMENEQFVIEEKPSDTIYFYENLCDFLTASHGMMTASKPTK